MWMFFLLDAEAEKLHEAAGVLRDYWEFCREFIPRRFFLLLTQ